MDKELKTISEILDKMYKDGYAMGKEEAYNKGLEDAWNCAREIVNSYSCLCALEGKKPKYADLFGNYITVNTFNISASEAIAKLKEYEEKQKQDDEIKVGDEIEDGVATAVVTYINKDKSYECIDEDGSVFSVNIVKKKTGRHFPQIAEVLKQMKEGSQHDD